jgi:signal transduction histidine kinase
LRLLIEDVLEIYLPRLAQRGGTASFVTAMPIVFVDAVRVSEVFNNLFSNAIKYSERPPRIEIGIDPDRKPPAQTVADSPALPSRGEFVTVFVRDNGIGIRSKNLGSIFQMFKRLHAAHVYGGGTGAGLAIARKIIERHRGYLWVESSFGDGTTFYLTLPTSA